MIQLQIDCESDISDAIDKRVTIQHQSTDTTYTNEAEFLTDGRDGFLIASFSSDQLDQAGIYNVQPFIKTINDEQFYGRPTQMHIPNNIGAEA